MNIKQTTIEPVALVMGLVLGSAMLVSVTAAFLLGYVFGLGGATLTLVGALLTGLSIWSSVRIRVSPEGGFEASFESFKQEVREDVTSLRSDTKGVVHELTEFKGEIRASILEAISPEVLDDLRRSEKVDQLIERGELEKALELDPGNTIAIEQLIENLVDKGQFQQASELYPELKKSNESGIGYSVYPHLALAFDRNGNVAQAQAILTELEEGIRTDIATGYGYLSRSQQIGWVLHDIQRIAKKVKDPSVAARIRELEASLKDTIDALTKG
ncbi:hypothetical protein SMC3_04250 [Candidatus Cryosericum hinesii]|uniref:Tetratricopeptide repeat protein n=2 Tax=Candidatus Cryosericum hinesii TaxID=2290915 RepID=A0A398DCT1_9BACT|nr:hypothetical protein [Candidatus Cryosericum hinesii]RIE13406.1 hypothetical protein SMC3_04250 [Candidatus Cryosericum hinesii]RIE13566.1 hypothetical protein SMC2_05030 [Candidatus Cryosericum hinesii]